MTWINAKIIVYKFYTPVTIYQSSYQYHQLGITETMADDSAVRETDVQAGASFDT